MGGVSSAVVLATLPGADRVVGGLPLAARAVLSLHDAGFAPVAVLAPGQPAWLRVPLARRRAPVTWIEGSAGLAAWPGGGPPAAGESVLLLAGNALVDSEALGSAHAAAAGPVLGEADVPVGVVCAPDEAAAAVARWSSAGGVTRDVSGARLGPGLAIPFAAAGTTRALEDRLLDALARRTAAGDSYLAALIDRRLSRPVTRWLLRSPLRPTHVTLLSVLAGLAGAAGLATVSYGTRLLGLALLVVSQVLDCVDGEMARARFEQSAMGARIDVVGDYVVHLAAFVGLATGLLRQGLPPAGAWAALALLGGVGAAMGTMHVLFVRPALQGGGDLHWHGEADGLRGTRLAAVAEKLASRDYTYLLLVLGLLGRLEWFLHAAAVGSWVFVGVLLAYRWIAVPAGRRDIVPR